MAAKISFGLEDLHAALLSSRIGDAWWHGFGGNIDDREKSTVSFMTSTFATLALDFHY